TAWVCLGSPCVGAYVPVYLEGTVPAALGRGGDTPDPASPWWRMRELLSWVEQDFAARGPEVRARWNVFETALARDASAAGMEAVAARGLGRAADAAALLSAFMARAVGGYQAELDVLVRELARG